MMTSIVDVKFFNKILEHLWETQTQNMADFLEKVVDQDEHIVTIFASICRDKRLRYTDALQ